MNNWYVVTGAPCSGKSTVLEILKKRGCLVIDEMARTYIDKELAAGRSLEDLRKDEPLFQKKVLQMKIDLEQTTSKEEVILFERGIPDSDAYFRLCGAEEDALLTSAMSSCSYKKIFLLEPIEYRLDYARTENKEQQQHLHTLLEESYKKIGSHIIKISATLSAEERADFIINNLS